MSRAGSAEAPRPGLSLGTAGFEAESHAYIQGRLRTVFAVAAAGATGLLAVAHALQVVNGVWTVEGLLDPGHVVHVASCVATAACWLVLRRTTLGRRGIEVFDALSLYIAVATCVTVYAFAYRRGPETLPGILSVFVIARAVIVPSSARRTLLLSLAAPLGVLAVMLAHGTAYEDGRELSRARYVETTFWYEGLLLFAVGVATVASRVNFSLRAQVREARKLGQYHLEEKIGEGGMGAVYRATHAMLRRPTAIKLLRPEITGEDTIRRFEREVQQTSRLSHPNTVAIYDYGRTPDGVFYYAMELLSGADLDKLVRAHGPFPAARAIHVLRQATGALAEAHRAGLVHRDIKPGNIILCERGGVHDVAKVVDFGLVRDLRNVDGSLTRVGAICGTPETISPEVLSGNEAGPAADLYALGVVGCFLLTGKPIFDVSTAGELIGAHLHSEPVPPSVRNPSVPRDLETVLLRCLAKDPAQRFPTAEALRAALASCAACGQWTEDDAAQWWRDHRSS